MADNVIVMRPMSYEAILSKVSTPSCQFLIAGTLEGGIDFAVVPTEGRSATYSLTCDDARTLIAGLHRTVDDIQRNCLFDRDPLLVDPR